MRMERNHGHRIFQQTMLLAIRKRSGSTIALHFPLCTITSLLPPHPQCLQAPPCSLALAFAFWVSQLSCMLALCFFMAGQAIKGRKIRLKSTTGAVLGIHVMPVVHVREGHLIPGPTCHVGWSGGGLLWRHPHGDVPMTQLCVQSVARLEGSLERRERGWQMPTRGCTPFAFAARSGDVGCMRHIIHNMILIKMMCQHGLQLMLFFVCVCLCLHCKPEDGDLVAFDDW